MHAWGTAHWSQMHWDWSTVIQHKILRAPGTSAREKGTLHLRLMFCVRDTLRVWQNFASTLLGCSQCLPVLLACYQVWSRCVRQTSMILFSWKLSCKKIQAFSLFHTKLFYQLNESIEFWVINRTFILLLSSVGLTNELCKPYSNAFASLLFWIKKL